VPFDSILPYEAITETLRFVASTIRAKIRDNTNSSDPVPKIQLFVCGHRFVNSCRHVLITDSWYLSTSSLGAALASICYSRFLKSEGDLGDDIDLRDAYCYGTPVS
jgi:hypothetical protein